MMSSEEENGEAKGKSSSTKRVRQRVDAGEPRNSYASIPNYTNTERRSLNGGFSRMLCDLGVIGALRKQHEMIVLDGGYNSSTDSSPPEAVSSNSTTNGLLRDILQQGRNGGHAPPSPDEEELMMNDDEEEELEDNNNDMQSQQQQPSPASGSESPPPTLQTSAATEAKRARVENIVSNMTRNGPTPVNGCKKRKLYQPQSTRPLSNGVVDEYDYDYEEEDHNSSPLMKRPNNGGNGLFTFKQQLRQMQQQLVAMQQQYMGMVDGGDSTDEDSSAPTHNNNNNNGKSQSQQDGPLEHSTFKTTEPPFSDCDNASLYDEPPRRHRDNKELLDYEWLAESLKAELSTSLSQVVDAVVARCARASKDIKDTVTPLSNLLDTKSPRTGGSGAGKVIDRGARANGHGPLHRTSPYPPPPPPPQQETPKPPVPPFFFHPLKPTGSVAATAAFLYGSPPRYPPSSPPQESPSAPEQTEAMSLVVASKKHKRHKVTDTRLQPPGGRPAPPSPPQPQLFAPPPPLVPVSLPTTVAIPNPSLHQSELFHFQRPPFDESPIHPSLLASFHHRGSPDTPLHLKQSMDDASDDSHSVYDPGMPMISFLPGSMHTSTLTPMHLRKAKLMFFFARYPSSAVLKMYFPDIRFNKNNTAQLVKWFSNFREFFYIQMEKYARQAITEGVTNADDLKVNADSELLRVLNLHYNRNNHIDAPETFRYVVEQTLREFYKALIAGKDTEQSWKKSIYKIIARMDDNVPEYFKSPNFFEQLD